ncbi:hypothetical protein WUBG_15845, partial [Wuchereria bancrofti]
DQSISKEETWESLIKRIVNKYKGATTTIRDTLLRTNATPCHHRYNCGYIHV